MRHVLLLAPWVVACGQSPAPIASTAPIRGEQSASNDGRSEDPDALGSIPTASEPAPPAIVETSSPPTLGCWQEHYGAGPKPGETPPSLDEPVPDCSDCDALKAGPEVEGLHVEILRRLRELERALPSPPVDEPVLWVNSGAREGPPGASMHNQALAVDVVICGLDTTQTAQHLREVGFPCVIEYFDAEGRPCNMAHGDLRGTEYAQGAYAPGGRKASTCPARAMAKGDSCQQSSKAQWKYAPDEDRRR